MSKVKFIQWGTDLAPKKFTDRWTVDEQNKPTGPSTSFSQLLSAYAGGVIFVTYTDATGKDLVQEIWANGVQYSVGGGVSVEGVLNNVLVFGSDNDIVDSGISKDKIDEGFTKSEYDSVNASEINSLDALRDRIKLRNTKTGATGAPENYTFDDFIKDLFQKVNAERKEQGVVQPSITASVSGGADVLLEVGDTSTKTSDVVIKKGTFTDGSFNSWKDTDGKSADSYTTTKAGCTETSYSIKEKDATTASSTNKDFTETLTASFSYAASGELAIPTTITKTSKQYVVEQTYTRSENWKQATTSYGNALFSADPITSTTCVSAATAAKQLNLSASFYHKIGNTESFLGEKTYSQTTGGQNIGPGTILYIPDGWNWTLSWVALGATGSASQGDHYTVSSVYVPLPCKGDFTKAVTAAPTDKPYKKYTKVVFTDTMVSLKNANTVTLKISQS